MRNAITICTITALVSMLILVSTKREERAPETALSSSAFAASALPSAGDTAAEAEKASKTRYTLRYERRASLGGRALDPLKLRGRWTTEPLRRRGRVEAALSGVELSGEDVAAGLDRPFQLSIEDGRLDRIGFERGVAESARDLLASIATAVQLTRKNGVEWTAIEEDLNGRYQARYTREPSGLIVRSRRYTAMGDAVRVEGDTRYTLDAQGLKSVRLAERSVMDLKRDDGMIAVEVTVELVREDATAIEARDGENLTLMPIRPAVKPRSLAQRDAKRLGNDDLPKLMAAFSALDTLPPRSQEEARFNSAQVARLAALLRLHPENTQDVARALLENAADPRKASILASALSSARTDQGRDALMGLMNEDLPTLAKRQVVMSLGRVENANGESAAALEAAMKDASLGSVPALALGAQAAQLDGEDADKAMQLLLDRYAAAQDYNQRRTALQALANSGSPRALEAMLAAIGGDDPRLAEVGAFGLRFIPGDEVDTVLADLLSGPALPSVRVEAIRAIGFRDRAGWRAQLEAALSTETAGPVHDAIAQLLAS